MRSLILRVPLIMLWGDGLTVCPWLVLIRWEVSKATRQHLIPHELCHVAQMRRDGWLRFWWRYLTKQSEKLAYEVEAYSESIANGMHPTIAYYLLSKYYKFDEDGSQLTEVQAKELIDNLEVKHDN
jgi:hypothetical protein